ncbi:LysM peptidoglycan-binding domain-containing protein [Mycolicibacterium grossiae]|uniref:Peptigoglycan-binding protein LysM n=1 Tax=Mycolicibacterium grossiae TaxID=1552759 RepID=A0A1E8QBD6_9MYCO|nr:LysM peptidoglycan-binding domain-containing protein [Mycolicibacterium grossiae]OFJ55354.1 peptigoglycan-binding protein LysM [Mycolicibacterium grossiae]QEM46243.1 LysM peptidoglycan-binding domain-containing protein [Mycolicibacterium grossiae]
MTIITRDYPTELVARPVRPRPAARRSPQRRRPAAAPLRYSGTGVLMSRASHRRKPITPVTTVLLALVAAGITVWLGLVAQFGAAPETPAPVPGELAVVQVQTGESLQQLAARIAPDAPVGPTVERIRELNELDTAGVAAGQTLIAPVG